MKFKKFISILLIFVMCFQLMPTSAWAAERDAENDEVYLLNNDVAMFSLERAGDKFTVDYAAQKDGVFLFAPQLDFEVSANAAENAGYTDNVVGGVSALDVLVAAHA